MANDHFQSQLDWVRGLVGDNKVKAGSVVSWQAISSTLNEMVKHFNTIALNSVLGSDEQSLKRYREVQLKKVVIGLLYEMDDCLDYWASELRKANLLDQDIVEKKKGIAIEPAFNGYYDLKDPAVKNVPRAGKDCKYLLPMELTAGSSTSSRADDYGDV